MGDMAGVRVEVEITGVAHGGIFVARHEGRVLFVTDAIPGERVVAEVTDDSKKSFWRAETVEVLEPSEHRRQHVWPAASIDRAPADRAGGAEFGHISLDFQRELKRRVITESLERMAGVESDVVVDALAAGDADGGGVPDATGTGWRTRVRLHLDADGVPGPFAARSHRVIRVDDLPLATAGVRDIAPLGERFPEFDYLDVIAPSAGDPFVLMGPRSDEAGAQGRPPRGKTLGRGSAGGSRRGPAGGSRAPRSRQGGRADAAASAPAIRERVHGRDFTLEAGGFWQVHRHAATRLFGAVQEAIDDALFDPRAANLDLYGGVGLLAAAVADRFGDGTRITTVESDAAATRHARSNLSGLSHASAATGRVEAFLSGLSPARATDRATIVIDPPRSGAGRSVVEQLVAQRPAQVIYVACDPVALSRDVGLFRERGFELTRLRAFDLFPNTHHVEAVATLVAR